MGACLPTKQEPCHSQVNSIRDDRNTCASSASYGSSSSSSVEDSKYPDGYPRREGKDQCDESYSETEATAARVADCAYGHYCIICGSPAVIYLNRSRYCVHHK